MDLGAIVEVAIGLIFVWIVLSLATIQIQEWINAMLDKRAKDMEKAIHEILANPNLKAQFYDHPLIRSLTAKKRKSPSDVPPWFYRYPIVRGFTKEKRKLPSYIPAQQFTLTLFDIAMSAGTESSLIQQAIYRIRDDIQKEKQTPKHEAAIEALNLLADLARSAAATEAGTYVTNKSLKILKAEVDKFSKAYPQFQSVIEAAFDEAEKRQKEIAALQKEYEPAKDDDPVLVKLKRGVIALGVISPEFNQTLNSVLLNVEQYVTKGETNLAQARKSVETWFDNSMDRVSGTFKRYSQWVALIVGFVVALLLNVDSINLTLYLWREPAVRQALATKASDFELPQDQLKTNPEQAMQNFRDQFAGLSLPLGWGMNETTSMATADVNCQLFPAPQQAFGIPIPWTNKCMVPPQSDSQTNLLLKLAGFVLTAVAAAQGAPFWFDILKKVVNLRSTGTNPAEKGK